MISTLQQIRGKDGIPTNGFRRNCNLQYIESERPPAVGFLWCLLRVGGNTKTNLAFKTCAYNFHYYCALCAQVAMSAKLPANKELLKAYMDNQLLRVDVATMVGHQGEQRVLAEGLCALQLALMLGPAGDDSPQTLVLDEQGARGRITLLSREHPAVAAAWAAEPQEQAKRSQKLWKFAAACFAGEGPETQLSAAVRPRAQAPWLWPQHVLSVQHDA